MALSLTRIFSYLCFMLDCVDLDLNLLLHPQSTTECFVNGCLHNLFGMNAKYHRKII